MKPVGTFPFGDPVQDVTQADRTPKNVFVLGVYASAVHALWQDCIGKTVVNALAVASEPYIFWRGENAGSIIEAIKIPQELGSLTPAKQEYNGPSGIALDKLILEPLGLQRKNAWLCDLVPHSCGNPSQQKAVERAYLPVSQKYNLPAYSVPRLPTALADTVRRGEILREIFQSQARVLILLGDQPVRWFLSYYDRRWARLSDFGHDRLSYGRLHETIVDGRQILALPLAHPRQIAKLGQSSAFWHEMHTAWVEQSAREISRSFLE